MKICKVIVPFIDKETGVLHRADEEIILSDKRIAEIRTVDVNMVEVIGVATKASGKSNGKKEPETVEVPEED